MLVDLPYEELLKYKTEQYKENDFEQFWATTISIAKKEDLNPKLEKLDYIIDEIDVFKAYYDGFEGAKICRWYLLPKHVKPPFPVLLWFSGYGDNKQNINYYLKWLFIGCAVFAIDIRGQNEESADNHSYPAPSAIGYMTKGIFSKEEYYRYV